MVKFKNVFIYPCPSAYILIENLSKKIPHFIMLNMIIQQKVNIKETLTLQRFLRENFTLRVF